jgi:NAD(P)-dependent dehydrogenase (short-subunit alcohol dehydrogenase family)
MPTEQVSSFGAGPVGLAGQPEGLAPAYVFLVDQELGYITGERIGVTGSMPMPSVDASRGGGLSGSGLTMGEVSSQ